MSNLNPSTIEAASRGDSTALRNVLHGMYSQLLTLGAASGTNILDPTNSPQKPITKPPTVAAIGVTGANGTFVVQLTPVRESLNRAQYHEVSCSPSPSFGSNVTVLPITSGTHVTYPGPGANLYWRVRSSFDQSNWSNYNVAAGGVAVAAGLQESSAISAGAAFNQTNFSYVTSAATGSSASISVSGSGGIYSNYVRVKGDDESIRPSATIVNVTAGTDQFLGYDPVADHFAVHPTLAQVLGDNLEPVGKVSVVETGAVVLPSVQPVDDTTGHVIGFQVTSQGNGLTGPVTIEITDPTGVGATAGAQTIQNGKLISVAPGNLGSGYTGPTNAVVSGGQGTGTPGGGTAVGGNGGRLTNV